MKKLLYILPSIALFNSTLNTRANGFNENLAKETITAYTEPLISVGLWLVPITAIIALLVTGITWQMKDEDEKESKPFMKTAKKIIFVAIFLQLVMVVLRMFGIS